MRVRLPVNLRQAVGAGISVALLAAATNVTGPCSAQVIETPTAEQRSASGVVEAFDIGAVPARCGALLLSGQAGGDDLAQGWPSPGIGIVQGGDAVPGQGRLQAMAQVVVRRQ